MMEKKIEKFGVQAEKARVVYCFRNGDKVHKGERMVLNMKRFKTYDQLKQAMTIAVKPRTGAIRKVCTPDGKILKGFEDFVDGGMYICCGAEPLDKIQISQYITNAAEHPTHHQPASAEEESHEVEEAPPAEALPEEEEHEVAEVAEATQHLAVTPAPAAASSPARTPSGGSINTPSPAKKIEKFGVQTDKGKVIMCFRNGDKHHKGDRMVVHAKKFKTFDQLLAAMTVLVKPVTGAIRKCVTPDGHIVRSFDEIVDGGNYICCGAEPLNKEQMPMVLLTH